MKHARRLAHGFTILGVLGALAGLIYGVTWVVVWMYNAYPTLSVAIFCVAVLFVFAYWAGVQWERDPPKFDSGPPPPPTEK